MGSKTLGNVGRYTAYDRSLPFDALWAPIGMLFLLFHVDPSMDAAHWRATNALL
jgi:hypothetical protein